MEDVARETEELPNINGRCAPRMLVPPMFHLPSETAKQPLCRETSNEQN